MGIGIPKISHIRNVLEIFGSLENYKGKSPNAKRQKPKILITIIRGFLRVAYKCFYNFSPKELSPKLPFKIVEILKDLRSQKSGKIGPKPKNINKFFAPNEQKPRILNLRTKIIKLWLTLFIRELKQLIL